MTVLKRHYAGRCQVVDVSIMQAPRAVTTSITDQASTPSCMILHIQAAAGAAGRLDDHPDPIASLPRAAGHDSHSSTGYYLLTVKYGITVTENKRAYTDRLSLAAAPSAGVYHVSKLISRRVQLDRRGTGPRH